MINSGRMKILMLSGVTVLTIVLGILKLFNDAKYSFGSLGHALIQHPSISNGGKLFYPKSSTFFDRTDMYPEILARSLTFLRFPFVVMALFAGSRVLYNLFLHPLRSIPGPFLARCTGLWIWWHHFKQQRSYAATDAHSRYGPIVRIGPSEICFASPQAYREIYQNELNLQKTEFYHSRNATGVQSVFSLTDPDAHNGRRKLQARAYSQASMLSHAGDISSAAKTLTNAIREVALKDLKLDILMWAHIFTTENLFLHAFGRDAGCFETMKPHWILDAIKESRKGIIYGYLFRGLVGPDKGSHNIPGFLGEPFRAMKNWVQYGKELIREEMTLPPDQRTSFMSRLTGITDSYLGRPLNDVEILEETVATMGGGIGSTANALSYVIFELARPEGIGYQNRLRKEIREAAVKVSSWPDYNSASKLPFMRACIREGLRKWPTIPGMLPRRVVGRPVTIDGILVPVGTVVGMQNMVHQRDSHYFPEPMIFRPDRWLSEDTSTFVDAFTPFGIGPRACIGQNLAMMQLTLAVAAIFRDLELRTNIGEDEMRLVDTFNGAPRASKVWVTVRDLI